MGSWALGRAARSCGGPPTFAQVVGAHEAGLGGPGPDPLPRLVLSAPEPAEQHVPLALVLEALAVGVVACPGACGEGRSGTAVPEAELKGDGGLATPLLPRSPPPSSGPPASSLPVLPADRVLGLAEDPL